MTLTRRGKAVLAVAGIVFVMWLGTVVPEPPLTPPPGVSCAAFASSSSNLPAGCRE